MKIKKIILFFMFATFLNSESQSSDNTQTISNILVGDWEWETDNNGCSSLESMVFRANGTFTSTSESCDLTSDGFGLLSYGWYIANDYVCFTHDERQQYDKKPRKSEYKKLFLAKVKEGYVKERCNWRVKHYSRKEIEIEIGAKSFTMIRSN